ncbi:hypothetical protein M0R45_008239 [Rubus argutus]|uniref:Endonuclease/exonuclease/phosphatase domain-containing protein n=1 Tax=Rubus argutus TaxID=59490 RepID=A0AAW1Y3H8_RUBAR
MKIISWNVRGVGRRSKRRVIKDKLLNSKADVIIIQETKKEVIDRRLICSIWGVRYTDWVSCPSNGSSGDSSKQWTNWWLSGVYGPNKAREREDFWQELAGLYGLCEPRWCVGGDFNVVRFPSEKSNGGRMTRSMRSFNSFLQDTLMRDPNLLNAEFTWSNLREEAVCCRLDRFIFTPEWEELFPNVRQITLARVTSDHALFNLIPAS